MRLRWFSLFGIGEIGENLRYDTGYHIKKTYLSCRASHSQVARPTPVGSPEMGGGNLDPHMHYEAHFWMGLDFRYHLVDLSGPLQKPFKGE